MARYTVSITVFKDPEGKTMKGPSFLHFLGDLCQAFGLIVVLGGISLLMDGALSPVKIAILAAMVVAGFWGGSLIHKAAKQKAQVRYLEALARAGKIPEEAEQS